MARRRRSGRSEPYDFRRGEPHFRSRSKLDLPPETFGSSKQRDDDWLRQSPVAQDSVYPWSPSRPLRSAMVSPYSQLRGARVLPAHLANQLSVKIPDRVKFCVQRKERRETLFALNRAGYSGSAKKRFWNRKKSSQWRC